MDSFAFFYEDNNKKSGFLKKIFKPKIKDIDADLHFNVWSLKKDNIFIDIGIKIYKINNIKKIFIYVPFLIGDEKKEIEDLSEKILDIKIANLIFNTDCNIDKENITMDGITCKIIDLEDKIEINKNNKNNSIIEIKLDDENINNNNIYIRFRIKNKNIKDSIMFTPKSILDFISLKKNVYKIIDIKINKKRNFPHDKLNNKYTLFSFNKIHFLLMEDIYSDINFLSKDIYESRILERGWLNYIGNNINNIIVFHYKKKSEKEKIEDCSIVIKVINKKQDLILLFIYILFALLISTTTSYLMRVINILYILLTVLLLFVIFVIFYLTRKW